MLSAFDSLPIEQPENPAPKFPNAAKLLEGLRALELEYEEYLERSRQPQPAYDVKPQTKAKAAPKPKPEAKPKPKPETKPGKTKRPRQGKR